MATYIDYKYWSTAFYSIWALKRLSTTITQSHTHISTALLSMTKRFYLAFTCTYSSGSIGGNSGFSIWPKDTSTQESEIDRPTLTTIFTHSLQYLSYLINDPNRLVSVSVVNEGWPLFCKEFQVVFRPQRRSVYERRWWFSTLRKKSWIVLLSLTTECNDYKEAHMPNESWKQKQPANYE